MQPKTLFETIMTCDRLYFRNTHREREAQE